MKASIARGKFFDAFNLCSMVVPVRPQRPAMGTVMMDATSEGCVLYAADGQSRVKVPVDGVRVDEPGRALLPKDRMHSILRLLDDDSLDISCEWGSLSVSAGEKAKFSLSTMDPGEFPSIEEVPNGITHTLNSRDLLGLIRLTSFAADKVLRMYSTGGLMVESGTDSDGVAMLSLVGTDGRRLAKATILCDIDMDVDSEGVEMSSRGILPGTAFPSMMTYLKGVDERVSFGMSKFSANLTTSRVSMKCMLLDGKFPRYRDVIPKSYCVRVPLSRDVILGALEQISTMTDNVETRAVTLRFCSASLRLDAGRKHLGVGHVEVPVDYRDRPLDIAIDPNYMVQALNVIGEGASVSLELSGEDKPIVLKVEGRDYTYILMPMKIHGGD